MLSITPMMSAMPEPRGCVHGAHSAPPLGALRAVSAAGGLARAALSAFCAAGRLSMAAAVSRRGLLSVRAGRSCGRRLLGGGAGASALVRLRHQRAGTVGVAGCGRAPHLAAPWRLAAAGPARGGRRRSCPGVRTRDLLHRTVRLKWCAARCTSPMSPGWRITAPVRRPGAQSATASGRLKARDQNLLHAVGPDERNPPERRSSASTTLKRS
jgi:hypothetical protein